MAKNELAVWLDFVSKLFWPATVLSGLAMFRLQIRSLLVRLSSFKVGDTELAFQAPDPRAVSTAPVPSNEVQSTAAGNFVTESTIRDIVRSTGLMSADDEIYRSMQLFSTMNQTTWLLFSKRSIFCVLDDDKTRETGKLLQWVLPRDQAKPVVARERSPGLGLLDVGVRQNWLYSTMLHPSPNLLKEEVERAIAEADARTAAA